MAQAGIQDTNFLYSLAWLDLSGGPLVLSLPDTGGRFYEIQFTDVYNSVPYIISEPCLTTANVPGGCCIATSLVVRPSTLENGFYILLTALPWRRPPCKPAGDWYHKPPELCAGRHHLQWHGLHCVQLHTRVGQHDGVPSKN